MATSVLYSKLLISIYISVYPSVRLSIYLQYLYVTQESTTQCNTSSMYSIWMHSTAFLFVLGSLSLYFSLSLSLYRCLLVRIDDAGVHSRLISVLHGSRHGQILNCMNQIEGLGKYSWIYPWMHPQT